MAKVKYVNGRPVWEFDDDEGSYADSAIKNLYTEDETKKLYEEVQRQQNEITVALNNDKYRDTKTSTDLQKTMYAYQNNLRRLQTLGYDTRNALNNFNSLQQAKDSQTRLYRSFKNEDDYNYWRQDQAYRQKYEGKTLGQLRSVLNSRHNDLDQDEYNWLKKYMADDDFLKSQSSSDLKSWRDRQEQMERNNFKYEHRNVPYGSGNIQETSSRSKLKPYITLAERREKIGQYDQFKADAAYEEDARNGANIANPTIKQLNLYDYDLDNAVNGRYDAVKAKYIVDNPIKVNNKLSFYLEHRGDGIDYSNAKHGSWESIIADGVRYNWDQLDEDEIKMYNYLLYSKGSETADKYLNDLQIKLDQKAAEAASMRTAQAYSNANAIEKIMLNVASIPAQVYGSAVSGVNDLANVLTGKELNPYSPAHSVQQFASDVRSNTAQSIVNNIDDDVKAKFAENTYQAAMSALDSTLGALSMGRAYTTSMGLGATSQRLKELYENGATRSQMITGAIGSGIIEVLTEYVSLDKFVGNFLEGNIKNIGDLFLKTLVQGGIEASEETASELLNGLLDAINRGANSDNETRVSELMKDSWVDGKFVRGMSEEQARKQATRESIEDVWWAAFGGFVSGGAMGITGGGLNYATQAAYNNEINKVAGKQVVYNNNVNALVEEANQSGDAKLRALANKVAGVKTEDMSKSQEKRYQKSAGKLYNQLQQSQVKALVQTENEVFSERATAELEKRGASNVKSTVDALTKLKNEEKLTAKEQKLVDAVEGKQLVDDITSAEDFDSAVKSTMDNRAQKAVSTANLASSQKSTFETSENNSTILNRDDGTSEDVTIDSIESVKNGKMMLNLSNGETVDAKNISFATKGQALLYSEISKLNVSPEAANEIVNMYKADSGMSEGRYALAAKEAYRYGQYGVPFEQIPTSGLAVDLSEQQRKIIYNLGKSDAINTAAQAEVKNIKKTSAPALVYNKNGVKYDVDLRSRSLNAQQKTAIQMAEVLSSLGADIHIFESAVKNGVHVGENGRYDQDTGAMYIDIAAGKDGSGKIMAYTLSHEFTHSIQKESPAKFKLYADALFQELGKSDTDIGAMLQLQYDRVSKMEQYKNKSEAELRDIAYAEMVAEATETMIPNTDAVSRLAARVKAQDADLHNKILEFFKNIATKLKEFVSGMNSTYASQNADSKIAEMARQTLQNVETLRDLWADAASDALSNMRARNANTVTVEGQENALFSDRKKYAEQVDDVKNNTHDRNNHVYMGTTPTGISKVLDLPKLPMLVTANHVYSMAVSKQQAIAEKRFKSRDHYHKLGWDLVKRLPDLINRPAMIIKSNTDANDATFVVVTSEVHNSSPIVAVIKPYGKGNYFNIEFPSNFMLSGYGKDGLQNYVAKAKTENRILYVNKNSQKNKNTTSVQFADNILYSDYGKNLSQFKSIVKSKFVGTIFENSSLFSMRDNVEETKDLLAVHNLTESQLLKSLKLGGLPAPSIAVIKAKAGHNQYGEISLVFNKDTIDPQITSLNKVYGGDVWSPVYPKIEYKPNEKVARKIRDKYYELSRKIGYDATRPLYNYVNDLERVLDNVTDENELLQNLKNDTDVMQLYLADQGKDTIPTVIKETSTTLDDEIIKQYNYILDSLGSDVMSEYENAFNKQEGRFSAIKEFHNKYADAIENAYAEFFQNGYGFTDEQIDIVISAMSEKEFRDLVRNAYKYSKNGATTVKTETDTEATKQAIRDAVNQDDYNAWINGLFKGIIEKSGIRNNKDYYTNNGNPRSWEALHWENNLENVVRVMKEQNQKGATSLFGANSIFAIASKEYSNIKEIKADSSRLGKISEEDYEAIKQDLSDRLYKVADEIKDNRESNPFIALDTAYENIAEAVRTRKTKSGIMRYLKGFNSKVTEKNIDDIISIVNDIANMPTGYFEAKPMRAVGFDEVVTAIIPDNASAELKTALADNNINTVEYKTGDDSSRVDALNSSDNALFSTRETTDGRTVAVVDDDILSGIDMSVWNDDTVDKAIKAAKNALNKFKDGITVNGITRKINRDTRREFTKSKYSYGLSIENPELFADKMRMASVADDVIFVTTNWKRDGFLKHDRTDNYVDFDHGNALIMAGKNKYRAEVVVGITRSGEYVFYDVEDINPDSFEIKNVESTTTATTEKPIGDVNVDSTKNNLPHPTATRQEGTENILKSDRTDGGLSNRTLLANALEGTVQNDIEKNKLATYKAKIQQVSELEQHLNEVNAQIKEISFGSGKRDMAKLSALKEDKVKTQNRINIVDKQLLNLESTQALKNVLEREKAKAIAKTKAEGKKALEEYKAKSLADQQALKDKYKENRAKSIDRRDRTEVRNSIKKIMQDLDKRMNHPVEGKYIPKDMKATVADILSSIDRSSGREGKASEKLATLNAQYKALAQANNMGAYAFDDTVSEMLNRAASYGVPLREMNINQLNDVKNALKAMDHVIKNAVKLNSFKIKGLKTDLNVYEFANKMIGETRGTKRNASKFDGYILTQTRPETALRWFGGYAKDSAWQAVYDSLDAAQKKSLDIQRRLESTFTAIAQSKEAKTLFDTKNLVDVGLKDESGNSVQITRGMMDALYMHLLNDQNARHVMEGGLTVPDMKKYYKGNIDEAYSTNKVRIYGVSQEIADIQQQLYEAQQNDASEEEIQALEDKIEELRDKGAQYIFDLRNRIEKQLSPYDLLVIQAAQNMYSQSQQYLNETTQLMYGFDRATVDNYFPIVTDSAFLGTQFDSISADFNLENAGFMKERTNGANPILLSDIIDTAQKSIRRTSQYAAFVPTLKDFNRVFGKSQMGYKDSVQNALENKFGKKGKAYIENLMADLNGGRMASKEISGIDRLLAKTRGNMAKSTLTINPRVAFSQSASLPTAAAELGYKATLYSLGKAFSKADLDHIAEYSPLLWYRMKGNVDTEIGDMQKSTTLAGKIDKKTRWATGWINAFDAWTVQRLWFGSEYWVKNNTNIKEGTDEFYKAVADKFDKVVERTQPNYTTLQRSDFLRSKNELVRTLAMFQTQRSQNFNILLDAWLDMRYTKQNRMDGAKATMEDVKASRKKLASAVSSQFVAAGTYVAIRLVTDFIQHNMNSYRDDDEELTSESVIKELLNQFGSTIAGMMLFGQEVYDFVSAKLLKRPYYEPSLSGISNIYNTLKDLSDAIDEVVKEDINKDAAFKRIEKLIYDISTLTGQPVQNVSKAVKGLIYHVQDFKNGMPLSMEAGVKREYAQERDILYSAILDGDEEKSHRFYSNMVESKIAEGSTEEEAEKAISSTVKGDLKEAFMAGSMPREEVRDILEYIGIDADIAEGYLNFWEFSATHPDLEWNQSQYEKFVESSAKSGISAEDYNEYLTAKKGTDDTNAGKLDAINSLDISADQRNSLLEENGLYREELYSSVILGDTATASRAFSHLIMGKTANGMSEEDAKKDLISDINTDAKAKFMDGELSYSDAEKIFKYAGADEETIRYNLDYWQFVVDNPTLDWNQNIYNAYAGKVKPYGISVDVFNNYRTQSDPISGDGKKYKIMDIIDSLPISYEQKDALYYYEGWTESRIYEAPWH